MATLRMIIDRSVADRTRVKLSTSKSFRDAAQPVHETVGTDHMATRKDLGIMGDVAAGFRDPMYRTTWASLGWHLLCTYGAGQIDGTELLRIILDCLLEGWPVDVGDGLDITADGFDDGSRIHGWIHGGHDERRVFVE
jgi:hypothetical protein